MLWGNDYPVSKGFPFAWLLSLITLLKVVRVACQSTNYVTSKPCEKRKR